MTGASRGIGRATALMFGLEGANVAVNYLKSKDEALAVVSELEKTGVKALAVQADVSKEKEVKIMIDEVMSNFGCLDVLVNNAGVVFDIPFKDKTLAQWQRTLDVNLTGVYLCSKYAGLQMLNQSTGGAIVNISSTNGIYSFHPECLDYDVSKAGVLMLTRDLAREFAPKIRVNAVAPGWVKTEMNKDLSADFIKKEEEQIYLDRFADPSEMAKVVLFLASSDASYITGSTIVADGGWG